MRRDYTNGSPASSGTLDRIKVSDIFARLQCMLKMQAYLDERRRMMQKLFAVVRRGVVAAASLVLFAVPFASAQEHLRQAGRKASRAFSSGA